MSTTCSDLTLSTINGETTESLEACLSEIIETISGIEIEQNKFHEIASYLYRVSPAIKLLQSTSGMSSNTIQILESLSRRIHLAKDILDGFQESKKPITSPEVHMIVKQMEGMIHYLGETLSSIPPSAFGEHGYAEIAVRSLSEEMKRAWLEATPRDETVLDQYPVEVSSIIEQTEMISTTTVATEVDLYSVQAEMSDSSTYLSEVPEMIELIRSSSSVSSERMINSSTGAVQDVAHYVEPPFEGFSCPLTRKIMQDPVTIESGATFERQVITQWFERQEDQEEIICPVTGRKLSSKIMFPSIALKGIIEEWKDRNETAKIKVIYAALSLASSDSMVIEALKDLNTICKRRPDRTREVLSKGIIPLIVNLLEYKDRIIRHASLETLQLLAKDAKGKELIGKTTAINSMIRMISSRFHPVKHAALLLLVELSNSATLSDKIGQDTGGILMLIRTKYDRFTDTFASEKADVILKNLAQSPDNIKCMAENGFLEPLLDNLVGGSENMKAEMANYLAEVVLSHDGDAFLVRKASPTLIKMTHSENALIRKAAFKALVPISTLHQNAKILVEAGISQVVGEEMFTRSTYLEGSDSVTEAAEILANLLESDLDLQKIEVTSQGHTVTSDYVTSTITYMLTSSNIDEIRLSLIRTISCLMNWSMVNIVSAIRDSEACYTLSELINNPDDKLGVAAIKVLIKLVPHMGQILVDKLCRIHGQPQGLVQRPSDTTKITERQVLSVKFLATLPHDNLKLNLSLLGENTVATVIQTINQIQATGTRKSRYTSVYVEGLVGILVRFTATLYEPQMQYLAVDNNFTTIFKDLLMETTSAEVKRLAAIGLEKLSVQSIKLSKPPRVERRSSVSSFTAPKFLASRSSGKHKITVCPIHRGVCSAQSTFCLFVSGAIEALLLCLDHQNVEVVEAALSALSTLLKDNVDIEKSISILHEMKTTQQLVKLVKDHTEESLLQKAFWIIEIFARIGGEEFAVVALQDRKFNSKLINSFYHGELYTRQIAENILTHLRIMPGSTITFS